MHIRLHNAVTHCLISVAWLTLFALAGCAVTSAHGADQYFQGNALKLAVASEKGDAGEIRRLMKDAGVNPDTEFSSRDGIPLLAWPLRAKNLDGLRAMLENGADPNARLVKTMNGEVIHFNHAMVYAAKMEDPRYLELLLKHRGDPNARNSNNEPLLLQAFLSGNQWENVKLLVQHGATINASVLSKGDDTVLSWYTGRGGFDAAYWLLEHGADPTIPSRLPAGSSGPARQTMVEDIYWEITTPELLPWQKKCQQWLIARNISRPALPEHIRKKREAFGLPAREQDIPLL